MARRCDLTKDQYAASLHWLLARVRGTRVVFGFLPIVSVYFFDSRIAPAIKFIAPAIIAK